jgi:hypothetical protein
MLLIPPKKNTEPPSYLVLSNDQMVDEVKLVAIRVKEEEVDIINQGTPQTLNAKDNKYSGEAGPAPGPATRGGGGAPSMPAMLRGVQGLRPGAPPSPAPSASTSSGGGAAIIAGGQDYSSPRSSGISGGATVSGGQGYVSTAGTSPANNVGNQIATTLGGPQPAQYRMPVPSGPPLPRDVQAATMVLQKAAMQGGGPPLPPPVAQAIGE